jgi:hypothetical protein
MEEPPLRERDEQVKSLWRRLNENFRGIAIASVIVVVVMAWFVVYIIRLMNFVH